ncbi:MAG: hypothetical protein EA398_04595 [Deltaproteobacteria bacterium]|nr:MAG: hypothetical protein EA398_04595 [Deltaproteobacteria bacterium]
MHGSARSTVDVLAPVTILGLYLLLAMVQLLGAQSTSISGFVFDRGLQIRPDSPVPATAPVGAGDRLLAIEGSEVATLDELAAVLAATRGDRLRARFGIEQPARLVRAGEDLRQALADRPPTEVVRLHRPMGLEGAVDWTVEEVLAAMPDLQATGFWAEVSLATELEGRVQLRRERVVLPSILLLAFGLIGLCALLLLRTESLSAGERGRRAPLWAAATGGLAIAALGVLAVEPALSLRWALHAAALLVLWKGAAVYQHLRQRGAPPSLGRRLLLLAPGLTVLLLAWAVLLGALGDAGTRADSLRQGLAVLLGMAGVLHVVDLALHGLGRDGRPAWLLVLAWLGTAVAGTALWPALGQDVPVAVNAWALLAAGVGVLWLADLAEGVPAVASRFAVEPAVREASPLRSLIEDAEQQLPGSTGWIAIGADGSWLRLGLSVPLGDGSRHIQLQRAPDAWGAALGILMAEGGIFPAPATVDTDDSPFDGLARHTGIVAMIPLQRDPSRPLQLVLVLTHDERDAPPTPDVDALASLAAAAPVSRTEQEAGVLALSRIDTLAEGARRAPPARRTRVDDARPAPTAVAAPTAVPASATPTPAGQVPEDPWRARLEAQVERAWPVDDEVALAGHERDALQRFVEDTGPTLVIGEAGGGKEFMARAIWWLQHGDRGRFLTVDAALLPPTLLEIDLLGDPEGEESGAVEAARGGALLVKTAQELEPRLVQRLAAAAREQDVRLFFAFRYAGPEEDVDAHLPPALVELCGPRRLSLTPLRERTGDIRRFAELFLHRHAMRYDKVIEGFEEQALRQLVQLDLPGNFHDLDAIVRAATLRSDGPRLSLDDLELPTDADHPDPEEDTAELSPAEESERERLVAALAAVEGNKSRAARKLGMSRGKLLRRLKKFGVDA